MCYTLKGERLVEKIKENIIIPDVIRRSYIETYRSCAFKFLKQVIEGHDAPPTSYTQIGIDMHEIFEDACNGIGNIANAMERMAIRFNEYDDSLFSSGFASDNREEMWQRTKDSIETFFEGVLPTLPKKPFTTEETIHFSVGEHLPKVEFTMDRIDQIDGELYMHDWKTGKVMTGQKLTTDLQAPLYIYGTQHHFNLPVRSFKFYYLKENKTREFVRTENPDIYECSVGKRIYRISLQEGVKEIQRVFTQIKKGNFNIPQGKSMHFACKVCHLKKEGKCEGADLQSWNNANTNTYSWS